jgi:ribosome-binding ATPase YchF (GTP1/OBG family)
MDRLGLVGLPNAGKSSLFNALTGGDALVAPHPFSTVDTEVGVAHVPDERLIALAEMSKSRRVVPATFEVVDIGAVQKSGEKGEALGARFLAGVREVDALALVLRSFEDDAVPGETDPVAALQEVELELVLADAASLENQLSKKRRAGNEDAAFAAALDAGPAALAALEKGVPIYRSELVGEERGALRPLFLLTNKPVLDVLNIGEDEGGSEEERAAERGGYAGYWASALPLEQEQGAFTPVPL